MEPPQTGAMRFSPFVPLLILASLALPAAAGASSHDASSSNARAADAGGARIATFSGKRLRGGHYLFRLRGLAPRRIMGGALYMGSNRLRHVSARKLRAAVRGNGRLRLSGHRRKAGRSKGRHGRASASSGLTALAAAPRSLRVRVDDQPPTTPGNLRGAGGDASAALSWTASTDNLAVWGYRVYRNGAQIAKLSSSTRSYRATSLTNGVVYTFAVRAYDKAGNLSPAAAVDVKPTAPSTSAPTDGGGTVAPPTDGGTVAPPTDGGGTVAPPSGTVGGGLPARLAQSTGSTYYVSTAGSDSNAGTQAAPWRTVQKALNTLTAGQTVVIRGGTYAQNLTMTRAGTATAPITIRNYPGERPILKAGSGATNNMPLQIGTGGAYVRFQGLTFDGATGSSTTNIYAWGSARDIEISDCESRGSQRQGFFSERGTARIQLIGCYFHDNGGYGPVQLDHNVYIEGSHNAVLNSLLTGAKNGYGIQIYPSSDHIVVAGNTITGNFRDGIVLGSGGATTTTDALIVNNIITNNRSAISTYWGGSVGTNNIARNNLAWGNSQTSFVGSGITYKQNVAADPRYSSLSGGNYRLQAGSPALDIADGAYASPWDLDGTVRPQGAGPDLGAYER